MYDKAELKAVAKLAREVADLADATVKEADENREWDHEARKTVTRPRWPWHGGTKTTGALRRRSMDLTRALAQLRKP